MNKFQQLSSLNLSFEGCSKFSNEGLVEIGKAISLMKCLQILKLNVSSCEKLNSIGLIALGTNLQGISCLNSIDLNLSHCTSIGDSGVQSVIKALENKDLFNLCFNLESCEKITDSTLILLSQSLISFNNLQQLNLNFYYCDKVTDVGFEKLMLALNSSPLVKLAVDFAGCKSITNKSMVAFGELLKHSVALKSLVVIVGGYNSTISDEGLKAFSENLAVLPLSTLYLKFRACSEVTNDGIIGLTQKISNLKELKVLNLDFSWIVTMSNTALKCLSQCISNLSLDAFILNCYDCKETTDEGVEQLVNEINTKDIKAVDLQFGGCEKVIKFSNFVKHEKYYALDEY
jgi:hypothetical protein